MNIQRKNIFIILLISLLLIVTACGSNNGSGNNSQAQPVEDSTRSKAISSQANQPTASSTEGKTSKENKELKQINISEPVRTIVFAPIYVAIAKGLFEKEGVKVNIVSGGGASQNVASILSGEAEFVATANTTFFNLLEKKQDVLAVASFNSGLTLQIVVSKQFMEKKGLTPDAPIDRKIAALKGATMGAVNLGGAHEIYLRNTMLLGGLNPGDVKVVGIGNAGANIVAMKNGIIDGSISGPPLGQQVDQQGLGKVWIDGNDLDEYSNMVYEVLFSKRKWIEQNPDITKAVVKAVGEGTEFVRDNPKDAAKMIQPFFQGLDLSIIEKGLDDIKYAFHGTGQMTQKGWENSLKPLLELSDISKIKTKLDTKENGFWTNKFTGNK